MKANIITLENGKNYAVIDTLEDNANKYLFFVNENDGIDVGVRKVVKKDNKEYITKLDSREELEKVMLLYHEKYERNGLNER